MQIIATGWLLSSLSDTLLAVNAVQQFDNAIVQWLTEKIKFLVNHHHVCI
jgi:hypothetical protein